MMVHDVGQAIRDARETAGLSRAAVEDRAGLSRRSLERYEQPSRAEQPSADALARIAVVLGTSVDALLGEGAAPPLPECVDGLVARFGARAVLEEIVRHV